MDMREFGRHYMAGLELENTNKQLRERQDIFEKKSNELERINKLMVDREMKMIELKEQVKQLQEKFKQ